MTNTEKIRTTFHSTENVRLLSSMLKSSGIAYDSLPAPIKDEIGYVKNLELSKKHSDGSYRFSGLVAMLGRAEDGQLLLRNRKIEEGKEGFVSSPFYCDKMEIFNPNALYADAPLIIVPDFLAALKLNSHGMNAISIGNSSVRRYLIPALDKVMMKRRNRPEVHFYLPEWNANTLKRALNRMRIKYYDLNDEISSFYFGRSFSEEQIQTLREILPTIKLQELPARKIAA